MLKIKDNVDLKDLVKFGFIYCRDFTDTFQENNYGNYVDKNEQICINWRTDLSHKVLGKIEFPFNYLLNETQDLLFDLIQAGLVEKADD